MMTVEKVRAICEKAFNDYPQWHTAELAERLLLLTIMRLTLHDVVAGRQRNPSGLISKDKLAVVLDDGEAHAYDLYGLQTPLTFTFGEVFPANLVTDTDETPRNGETPGKVVIAYDEQKAVEFGMACNDVYLESKATFDPGMIAVQASRAAWDYYVGGLSWEDSKRKHVNEFRAEYGLPPI